MIGVRERGLSYNNSMQASSRIMEGVDNLAQKRLPCGAATSTVS